MYKVFSRPPHRLTLLNSYAFSYGVTSEHARAKNIGIFGRYTENAYLCSRLTAQHILYITLYKTTFNGNKIRLQRHGRKNYAFYPIVIADSRAPRDGRFIERIGSYNPNTNPATITLNFERALYWVNTGAQPTNTVRNILSREGVMLMKHLQGGVKKGAFDEAEAQRRFDAWKADKSKKIEAVKTSEADKKNKRLRHV